jgi:DNA-binding MarR family transcriptional regulator
MSGEPRIHSELDVLAAVEEGVVVTQATLTKRIGVSIGLVNALLKRAIQKGYVKTKQAPYKRYVYYLTPKGFAKKTRLVADYLDFSLRFFRSARDQYADLISTAKRAGKTRLVLIGGGELAEIALLAAWGEGLTPVGIIDRELNEPVRYGLTVYRSLSEAGVCDAAVITDTKQPQKTYEAMRAVLPTEKVLAPALLKITPDQADLIAARRCLEGAA